MLKGEGLKPCPFCGGEANADYGGWDWELTGWMAFCKDFGCIASTPLKKFDTEEQAIAAWNRRADPPK